MPSMGGYSAAIARSHHNQTADADAMHDEDVGDTGTNSLLLRLLQSVDKLQTEIEIINVRLDSISANEMEGVGRRETPTLATSAELSGANERKSAITTREALQDHMFKISMRKKEQEAAKQREIAKERNSKRMRLAAQQEANTNRRGTVFRTLFLPPFENRILWGLIRILQPGEWKKTVLELLTIFLVLLSVSLIILQSYAEYEDLEEHKELYTIQIALLGFFTLEYIVRWTSVRPPIQIPRPYSIAEYYHAKLMYTVSFMPMIDLLSILPFYIELILKSQGQEDALPGSALMIFRVIRVLRIFKLTRNNQTIVDFVNAMWSIISDLMVFMAVLATCVVLVSTAIYYAEMNGEHSYLYPDIPSSMWWTVITFTSVGYGDVYPVTDAGKVVGAFAALLGVLLMNIPIAFVLISFDEVYSTRKARENRMLRIVQHVFAWADRHKKVNPLQEVAAPSSNPRGSVSHLKLFKKREIYKLKKDRKRAKRQLLQVLMNPHMSARLIPESRNIDDDDHTFTNSPDIMKESSRREDYLMQKYFRIWHERVVLRRHRSNRQRFKWIKSSSRVAPANPSNA